MASKIQLRRDTKANWTLNNPVLSSGEVGIETDTLFSKVGDGSTAWSSLVYSKINPTLWNAITSMTVNDLIPVYDSSGVDITYITGDNLLKSLHTIETNITTLATNDTISVNDVSTGVASKITEANLANSLVGNRDALTAVATNDYISVYDTSASTLKKITPSNLLSSTISSGSAITTTADNDLIPIYDTSAAIVSYITSANKYTDDVSRDVNTLAAAKAVTIAGNNHLDAVVLSELLAAANTWTAKQTVKELGQTIPRFMQPRNYYGLGDYSGWHSQLSTITVGTNPTGVAYCPVDGYVYVANYGSGTVSYINPSTHEVVSTITVGINPFEVAYCPVDGYVYVANSGSGTVSYINPSTHEVVSTITVGTTPLESPIAQLTAMSM